ncbi:hypothetical protein [Hoeflea ulvae]|uniref:Uncharacterized protein n=1 Tax=Hoeflea ulvae TaxID=2983764 RepID=A0ABT3YH86_9HYPH|nr:hypothetical protein [Hoeflea ulvae]MCY0095172.1 hypothetical protein [Hoeflea ulvae]
MTGGSADGIRRSAAARLRAFCRLAATWLGVFRVLSDGATTTGCSVVVRVVTSGLGVGTGARPKRMENIGNPLLTESSAAFPDILETTSIDTPGTESAAVESARTGEVTDAASTRPTASVFAQDVIAISFSLFVQSSHDNWWFSMQLIFDEQPIISVEHYSIIFGLVYRWLSRDAQIR